MTTEEKTYFIYVRSTGEKVPVTKAQHDAFYKEADRIRHKEQNHGRCMRRTSGRPSKNIISAM